MPKCKHCLTKFEVKFFNQKYCLQNDECRNEATNFAIEQKEKNFKAKCVTDRLEYKAKNKTYTQKVNEAKLIFQAWVRNRDNGLPCISCGNPNPSDWSGGHYFPAGVYRGLIFDERNCNAQCNTYCNKYLSGNLIEYRLGLINRYGKDFVEQLESEKEAKRVYKWSDQELENIKQKYKL